MSRLSLIIFVISLCFLNAASGNESQRNKLPIPNIYNYTDAEIIMSLKSKLDVRQNANLDRQNTNQTKVFIVTTINKIPYHFDAWISYHRSLGIDTFYIFYHSVDPLPKKYRYLFKLDYLHFIRPTIDLNIAQRYSNLWKITPISKLTGDMSAIHLSIYNEENSWLIPLETDTLLFPKASRAFSLSYLLSEHEKKSECIVRFPLYEAIPENAKVTNPFSEITLFRKNSKLDIYNGFQMDFREKTSDEFRYFQIGTSAIRLSRQSLDPIFPAGPFRFTYKNLTDLQPTLFTESFSAKYAYTTYSSIMLAGTECSCRLMGVGPCLLHQFSKNVFKVHQQFTTAAAKAWFEENLVLNDTEYVDTLLLAGTTIRDYSAQFILKGGSIFQKLANALELKIARDFESKDRGIL